MKSRNFNEVRCPCGGVVNNAWLAKTGRVWVTFVFECWSGDLNKDKPRHIFIKKIRVLQSKMESKT